MNDYGWPYKAEQWGQRGLLGWHEAQKSKGKQDCCC